MVGFERSDEQKKNIVSDPCNLHVFVLINYVLVYQKRGVNPLSCLLLLVNVGSLICVPIFFAPVTYPPFWNLCTLQDSSTTPLEIADYSGKFHQDSV